MRDDHALRILLQVCSEMLAEARAGGTWLAEMVAELERLCGKLANELEGSG